MIRHTRSTIALASFVVAGLIASLPAIGRADEPVAQPAPPVAIDTTYIPASATVAVIVHPQSMFSGSNAEWMPVEVITAVGMQQYGVDPTQIEEAVVSAVPPPAEKPFADPRLVGVVRFLKPISKDSILAKLPHPQTEDVAGKTFYSPAGRPENSIYLPDDKTLVFGDKKLILESLAAKSPDSPLIKIIKNTDCSSTLTMLASLDAMRDLVTELLRKLPPLPPALDQFRKIPMLISSAKAQLDFGSTVNARLTLNAVDAQSAGELAELINRAIAMTRQIMVSQMQQQMKQARDNPVQLASLKYATRLSSQILDKLKPEFKGQNVKIEIHSDGGPVVVGAIIAFMLPAVQASRESADRIQSLNNLRQLSLALRMYEASFGYFPQRAICDKKGKPLLSWRVAVLPFVEENELYKQFHLDEPWDSLHNKPLIARIPKIFCNPKRPNDGKTNYLVTVGKDFGFDSKTTGGDGRTLEQITDGDSFTILLLEADEDRAAIWTKPEDLVVDPTKPLAGLGHFNTSGDILAAFFDGHVQRIPNTVQPDVFKAALTIAGGEDVRLP